MLLDRIAHTATRLYRHQRGTCGLAPCGSLPSRQCYSSTDDASGKTRSQGGLPEVVMEVDDPGGKASRESLTEEEFKARQSKAVEAWLEHRFGNEKVELVKLLQKHGVIVRGGPEGGESLIAALLEWKADKSSLQRPPW
ncbi:hypothetical protein WJX73_009507 [Symbiochloris irregularis]|uniref:Uncharacterized protein n=1 Tax=Symbiochloris irregularis TaxID=706552 RepID=A0AAW1P6E6_9CHLO